MEIINNNFQSEKVIAILDSFSTSLKKIKLEKLSSELYELINILNIIKAMLKTEYVSDKNLKEIEEEITLNINKFLTSVNDNLEIKTLIDNNYYKLISELYNKQSQFNNIAPDNLYKSKYLKYKQKYNRLKNKLGII